MIFQRTRATRRQAQAGFTLVELLVVTAIISILAGMLLPALERTLGQARQISCANNLKQLSTALDLYSGDWNDYMVINWYIGPSVTWAYPLNIYLGIPLTEKNLQPITKCPADLKWFATAVSGVKTTAEPSYGYNLHLGPCSPERYHKQSDVKRPSQTIRFADSGHYAEDLWYADDLDYVQAGNYYRCIWSRHAPGANIAWCDGHVRFYVELQSINEDTSTTGPWCP